MSVVVTVAAVGAVTVGTKVFAGLAAAAAAHLGMKAAAALAMAEEEDHRAGTMEGEAQALQDQSRQIEVSVATNAALQQAVAERCELNFTDGAMSLKVSRDIRGKVTVTAHGRGLSRQVVTERADRFLGLLQQQVAYRRIMTEVKQHGFSAAQEEVDEDGTVRLRITRRKR